MPTFVDLLWQVKNKLPIKFGGTGNDLGAARDMLMLHYMNDSGGAIALGTLVKLHGSSHDDLRVIPTTTANELGVLGVVVGRFTTGDGLGLFEATAPAHQDTVAVCIAGRCRVLVESAVTQGQYAYVAATDGKAAGSTAAPLGAIGRFEQGGSTSALVVLTSGGGTAAISAPTDVYEDGVLQVDGFEILDFGAHLDVLAAGTTASVAVVTDEMTLDAEQVLVEDVGTYYTPPAPGTGTETLRPTSDFTKSGTITYTSGTTGYNLVDEVSLDTADNYHFGAFDCYLIHGFPASALTVGQQIDSVQIRCNTTNGAPASACPVQVRDPNTGTRYDVQSIGQNSAADAGEVLLTTRPWDSQPWELTDVQQLQVGFGGTPSGAANLRIRQLYLEINWTNRVTVESALAELGSLTTGGDILVHTTSEMDADLVLAPDGAGGVEFRAETGGGGGGTAFIGARATGSGTQSINSATETAVQFNGTDSFDTDAFHDPSSNNTRFTVPTGLGGKYLMSATIAFAANATGYRYLFFRKNGTTNLGYGTQVDEADSGSAGVSLTHTDVADLAAGDYVEVMAAQASGGALNLTADRFMSIVKLDSGKVGSGIGAKAYNAGTQAIGTGSETSATLDSEAFDTDGFHDTGSNTSRMTIPTGLGGKYIIVGGVFWESQTGGEFRAVYIKKNSSTYEAMTLDERSSTTGLARQSVSVILDLVPTDYVELRVVHDRGSNLNIGGSPMLTHLSIVRLDSGSSTTYTASRWTSGTAFPSGPATNDRFTRTDRGLDYYYDGTRWLSAQTYTLDFGPTDGQTQPISATSTNLFRAQAPYLQGGSDIWLLTHHVTFYVVAGTALSGSDKWVGTLRSWDSAVGETALITTNIDSGASDVFRVTDTAIGALLHSGSTKYILPETWTKTGTPGNLRVQSSLTFRLVG